MGWRPSDGRKNTSTGTPSPQAPHLPQWGQAYNPWTWPPLEGENMVGVDVVEAGGLGGAVDGVELAARRATAASEAPAAGVAAARRDVAASILWVRSMRVSS